MTAPPFPQDLELNRELEVHYLDDTGRLSLAACNVSHIDQESNHLPGEPHIPLSSVQIPDYLSTELLTPDLDAFAPYLWLVGIQRSSHISALHAQIVKGRNIIITENPELHCTWIYDSVFFKPIPPYLLSWAFWKFYLYSDSSPVPSPLRTEIRKSALGFLRTYCYLIKHKSDFRLAKQNHLIPEGTSYSNLLAFFSNFSEIADMEVSPRYNYGELRLSRLNSWAKIFLRRFTFQKVQTHYRYGTYFARFYGPLLFVFAFFTVVLSAMQIELTIDPSFTQVDAAEWGVFVRISQWFSVATIIFAVVFLAVLLALFIFMVARETIFALRTVARNELQKRRALSPAQLHDFMEEANVEDREKIPAVMARENSKSWKLEESRTL